MQEPWWKGETGSGSQSCAGIDVQEEEGDRSPWSWDGNYRGLGVPGWVQRAERRSLPPPQGMQEGGSAAGPNLGLCPLLECLLHVTPASSACPPFVTPTWRSCSGKMLSSVPLQATSSIQILPVPVETSGHDVLAEMRGAQDRREHCSRSAANSLISGSPAFSTPPRPMPLL